MPVPTSAMAAGAVLSLAVGGAALKHLWSMRADVGFKVTRQLVCTPEKAAAVMFSPEKHLLLLHPLLSSMELLQDSADLKQINMTEVVPLSVGYLHFSQNVELRCTWRKLVDTPDCVRIYVESESSNVATRQLITFERMKGNPLVTEYTTDLCLNVPWIAKGLALAKARGAVLELMLRFALLVFDPTA